MADTRQVVSWALGQSCPLRPNADWSSPSVVETISCCQTYSDLRKNQGRGFGVFGDICVHTTTGAVQGLQGGKRHFDYPSCGFHISSQFSAVGGLAELDHLCGNCPANVAPDELAGCTGYFDPSFFSERANIELESVIERLGLKYKLDSLFPSTSLPWLRFWINSPIPEEGADVLLKLFKAVCKEEKLQQGDGRKNTLSAFVQVLERSVANRIPLEVVFGPPGHTDFGLYTVFPHCPRCKVEAPVKRWKEKYPEEEMVCTVCGGLFSPAKTHSRMRDEPKKEDLRKILGQTEFEKLAACCLMAQGASELEALEVIRIHEQTERERREKWAQRTEEGKRNERFAETVIYAGLKNLSSGDESESKWSFTAPDMEEIISRCKRHGGKVFFIMHKSESGEHDEMANVNLLTSPMKALQKLKDNGCDEKFSVHMEIPEEVVVKREKSLPQ